MQVPSGSGTEGEEGIATRGRSPARLRGLLLPRKGGRTRACLQVTLTPPTTCHSERSEVPEAADQPGEMIPAAQTRWNWRKLTRWRRSQRPGKYGFRVSWVGLNEPSNIPAIRAAGKGGAIHPGRRRDPRCDRRSNSGSSDSRPSCARLGKKRGDDQKPCATAEGMCWFSLGEIAPPGRKPDFQGSVREGFSSFSPDTVAAAPISRTQSLIIRATSQYDRREIRSRVNIFPPSGTLEF